MGFGDDLENKAKDFGGKAKETVGDATGSEDLKSEGREQQGEAAADRFKDKVSEAGEKVGDAAREGAEKASGFVKGVFGKDDDKQ